MKKAFTTIVSLAAVAPFLLASCGKSPVEEKKNLFEGVHVYTAEPTSHYLVQDGRTDYKIIIPSDASLKEKTAREEFSYFFLQATDLSLPVYTDADFEDLSTLDHYISIGDTKMLRNSGIEVDYGELGTDGVRIVTSGNNIFLSGARDSGTVYSVYDFMEVTFHYRQYTPDFFEIDSGLENVRLLNYDVKDIPDIPLRANGFGYYRGGSMDYDYSHYGYRMRMEKDRGYHFMPVYSKFDTKSSRATSTNTNTYIPYADYYDAHKNWFSNKCKKGEYQLCYTAHGDQAERKLLVEEVAKKVEFSLMNFTPELYPEMNVITFTMEDNFNTCECEECVRQSEKYGADSGPLNVFVNDVGALVEEWMNQEENAPYKRDDFHIIYFAYNAYESAPAKQDENGKWVPTYPEVKLRSNVGVYFAEITVIDYQKSLFHPDNQQGKDALDGWRAISDFMYYWTYETNFHYLMYFYDTFDFFTQEMYNYVASQGLDMFFGEAQESCGSNGVNWNALKGYLDARLSWDSTLDQDALMKDYFRAVFGDAQYEMRELFDLIRAHNAELLRDHPDLSVNRSCYNMVRDASYYPLNTLENFLDRIDRAEASVAKLKDTNPSLYEKIINHIEAEAFTYLYIILDLHSGKITVDRRIEILNRLYADVERLSIQTMALKESGATILTVLDAWKKAI